MTSQRYFLPVYLIWGCTDFDRDRVNFFSSIWYSALFWIYQENNVDNTPIFWLLLRSAYFKSRILSFPCSASEELHEKLGGSMARMADCTFCTIEHHAQFINWENCPRASAHRDGLGISQWGMSNSTVHHLFFMGFILLSLLFITLFVLITILILK